MINETEENVELSSMSDESLRKAIEDAVTQLNIYSKENNKREQAKYQEAKKEYDIAYKKLTGLNSANLGIDSNFHSFLFSPALNRLFH